MSLEKLTLTSYSTALFSTWHFIDELAILFDCGDGVSAGLLQKSRKIKHVFISHADRDHVAGLLQFSQLNSRDGLTFYYPQDCGTFPALSEFTVKFDPQVSGAKWQPIKCGDEIQIRSDVVVRTLENRHVPTDGTQIKSLSYIVERRSRKLKPEWEGLPGTEIQKIRTEQGDDAITTETRTPVLAYSGDTPIDTDGRFNQVETLIHEATFLTSEEIEPNNPRRNKHSSLDQVLEMVADSNIKRLVLGHFSSRYDHEEIDDAIRSGCLLRNIEIPVHRILPGVLSRDALSGKSILSS